MHKPLKLTKAEQEQDELLLAALIAGAETNSNYNVQPGGTYLSPPGVYNGVDYSGHACAVGAGILYSGIDLNSSTYRLQSSRGIFVELYQTSWDMALGISNGFECPNWDVDQDNSKDYLRGYQIGAAVRGYSTARMENK